MHEESLLLSVSEAASLLRISRSMAYSLISRGILPHVYLGPGRLLRVPRGALQEWIDRLTCDSLTGGRDPTAVHSHHHVE